jgi:hypothetical protein
VYGCTPGSCSTVFLAAGRWRPTSCGRSRTHTRAPGPRRRPRRRRRTSGRRCCARTCGRGRCARGGKRGRAGGWAGGFSSGLSSCGARWWFPRGRPAADGLQPPLQRPTNANHTEGGDQASPCLPCRCNRCNRWRGCYPCAATAPAPSHAALMLPLPLAALRTGWRVGTRSWTCSGRLTGCCSCRRVPGRSAGGRCQPAWGYR